MSAPYLLRTKSLYQESSASSAFDQSEAKPQTQIYSWLLDKTAPMKRLQATLLEKNAIVREAKTYINVAENTLQHHIEQHSLLALRVKDLESQLENDERYAELETTIEELQRDLENAVELARRESEEHRAELTAFREASDQRRDLEFQLNTCRSRLEEADRRNLAGSYSILEMEMRKTKLASATAQNVKEVIAATADAQHRAELEAIRQSAEHACTEVKSQLEECKSQLEEEQKAHQVDGSLTLTNLQVDSYAILEGEPRDSELSASFSGKFHEERWTELDVVRSASEKMREDFESQEGLCGLQWQEPGAAHRELAIERDQLLPHAAIEATPKNDECTVSRKIHDSQAHPKPARIVACQLAPPRKQIWSGSPHHPSSQGAPASQQAFHPGLFYKAVIAFAIAILLCAMRSRRGHAAQVFEDWESTTTT
ncbi:hypothetical protein CYLTODRAFT_480336 [Cylindrobasidium torrendii FP15055 ss-10]|uniref:Uncharacterized protein n=1 Tax=Cylindrobasidium torrendii FP15055 ss-10 TaxID=1314674 RepID=A0A0D7AUZ3_9AGAR|nr:hypothetical protein CYLTODRAFT_480336 [Cylindrobasidium torrendii FP15055 ss-10]